MNAIDHHSSGEPQSLAREVAREQEVGDEEDAAAEELRGRDADHVERLVVQREVAHEQARAAVADRAEQGQRGAERRRPRRSTEPPARMITTTPDEADDEADRAQRR